MGGTLTLFGGAGHDPLTAGAGNDVLMGGGGADVLTGGGGADTFRYDATSDSSATPDLIGDFLAGTDRVDLGRIDADSHAAGNQAFRWIGPLPFTGAGPASAGELRAWQDPGGSWFVEGDTDGDGDADLVIELALQGPTPLGADNFLL